MAKDLHLVTEPQIAAEYQVPRSRIGGYARYGMSAGVVSGLLSTFIAMTLSYFFREGFYLPLNAVAAGWFGPRALIGGTVMGLIGMFTILIVAMVWGACFGMIVGLEGGDAKPFIVRLIIGVLLGVLSWLLLTFLVLPWGNPVMGSIVARMQGAWFIGNLVFGAFLAVTPVLLRSENPEIAREPDPRMV
jgi:hypothetical protein